MKEIVANTGHSDGFRPDSIDDTQPTELVRDETPSRSSSSGTFQLRSQSTEVCHNHKT